MRTGQCVIEFFVGVSNEYAVPYMFIDLRTV
jgi:hypothetical protein